MKQKSIFNFFLRSLLGFVVFTHVHSSFGASDLPLGISKVAVESLSKKDQARVDVDHVYIQMAWSIYNYPKISKFEMPQAKARELNIVINQRFRRALPVVEFKHPFNGSVRPLIVMLSGLFSSEWQDLHAAKKFFDWGYDVLKLPTAFSESFAKFVPWVDPGNLGVESEVIKEAVVAYLNMYRVPHHLREVIGFGTSYGATSLIKASEAYPNFFSKVIAVGPVYDFEFALNIFDSLLAAPEEKPTHDDAEKGVHFWMSSDPRQLDRLEFDAFAKERISEHLLLKLRSYCVAKYPAALHEACHKLKSFADMKRFNKNEFESSKLSANQNPNIFVLTTNNDPLNKNIVAIGRTRVLQKGGHFGFLGTEVSDDFIKTSLEFK